MSAIFGIWSLDAEALPEAWIARTMGDLRRLGPDRQSLWRGNGMALGHCQFQTTLEAANEVQPAVFADAGIALVMTGLLIERQELADALGRDGASADSILVLAAYQRFGEAFVERLDGEFSIGIVETRDRARILLAQSRAAATPLYFARGPRHFAFATRALPLTRMPGMEKQLDNEGFARELGGFSFSNVQPARTLFRGIERCPAATLVVVTRRGESRREYWSPITKAPEQISFAGAAERARSDLRRAVRSRTRSAHPVACLLSGGLDSSSITCLAAEKAPPGLFAVSSVLPDGPRRPGVPEDERTYIEIVRKHLGIEVVYVAPLPQPTPWEFSDALFAEHESPLLSPRHYLYDALSKAAAARGARVVLDGSFGEMGPSNHGRGLLSSWLVRGHWLRLARATRLRAVRSGRPAWRIAFSESLRPAVSATARRIAEPRIRARLRPAFLDEVGRLTSAPPRSFEGFGAPSVVGMPRLWHKAARPPIYGGTVFHLPFRDFRLWQGSAALPLALTQEQGYTRALLREAMAGILPREIQWRTTKSAFSPDYYARLEDGLGVAREIAASVRTGELAERFIDVEWLCRTLADVSHRPLEGRVEECFELQATLCALQFLRWFERQ